MDNAMMKVEVEAEACCVCGATGEELFSPEEHDAISPSHLPPLRAMLLHLNHSKTVPSGQLCTGCIRKTEEAYRFSTNLASKGPPPLSEKIRALRKRLHELTQKIDVFIVVGGEGANGVYNEEDIIMVDRDALAAASQADEAELLKTRNMKGENVYQCTVCPLTFQRVCEYQKHVATHGAHSVHSCWTCGAQFASAAAAVEHRATHHAPKPTHCYLCNQTFQSQSEFVAHEPGCSATCPACGLRSPSRAALRTHARTHAALCARCFCTLPSRAHMHAHALTHRQESQFVCGYDSCILRFANRSNLVSHIRKCHGDTLAPPPPSPTHSHSPPTHTDTLVPCPHCSRTFATTAAMKRHARVHKDKQNENKQIEQDTEWTGEEMDGKVEYLEVETLEDMDDNVSM